MGQAAIETLFKNYSAFPFSVTELVALVGSIFRRLLDEPLAGIRIKLVGLLERLLRIKKPLPWHQLAIPGDQLEGFAGWFVSLAVEGAAAAKRSKKLKVNDLLFTVLSFVGANDYEASVRLAAIKLLGRMEQVDAHLLAQACKKDVIASHAAFPLKLSVLCCGLFSHGVEEQFMKVRFEALNALYALSRQIAAEDVKTLAIVLGVFVDAWLDECDWIRLAALKLTAALIADRPDFIWPLEGGPLEALLAALDDFNGEIRAEALGLLGHVRTVEADAILRTQRCLEALVLKHEDDKVHARVLECAVAFANGNKQTIKSNTSLLSHFLGSADARYFAPATNFATMSTVQQAFLVPLLQGESDSEARRLAFSLMASFDDENIPGLGQLVYRNSAAEAAVDFASLSPIPLVQCYPARMTDASVRARSDLSPADQAPFYFPGPVFCRFNRVRCDPPATEELPRGQFKWILIEIGGFQVIGPPGGIRIAVGWSETTGGFKELVGQQLPQVDDGCWRVKVPVQKDTEQLSIRIVNQSNSLLMWPPIQYTFK